MGQLPKETAVEIVRKGPLVGSLWERLAVFGGEVVTVVCTAIREEDLSAVVIFRGADGIPRTRTLAEFAAQFKPGKA